MKCPTCDRVLPVAYRRDVELPTGSNKCHVCGAMYAVPGAHGCDPRVVKPRSQSVPGRLTFTTLEKD